MERRDFLRGLGAAGAAAGALPGLAWGKTPVQRHDVVVYGATPAGIMAAWAASLQGVGVALIEPSANIGGMVAGGLSQTDTGPYAQIIGGLTKRFFERVGQRYGSAIAFDFEPGVAESVFRGILDSRPIRVFMETSLEPGRSVHKSSRAEIVGISTSAGIFEAYRYIDATYEGDLMAAAGVQYRVGRESRNSHGESLAGLIGMNARSGVSAYDSDGKLSPLCQPRPKQRPGDPDGRIMAYNYRPCLTRAAGRTPFPKPPGYDPAYFEIVGRLVRHRGYDKLDDMVGLTPLQNGKFATNGGGIISLDSPGLSYHYPESDGAARAAIVQRHYDYGAGFLYYLANEPSLPAGLRKDASSYGLAADEFIHNGNWPTQLYVREARRMVGEYFMTQPDTQSNVTKGDPICLSAYDLDAHAVERFPGTGGRMVEEGSFLSGNATKPFQIPYRAILPQAGQASNLLVPVCISASHVAFSAIRLEPQYMMMGEAAGWAAALSAEAKVLPAQLSYATLADQLTSWGSVLSFS